MKKFLKTKYYPVDVDKKVIYDDPKNRELDASLSSEQYRGCNTIGLKGRQLNENKCYLSFSVVPALSPPSYQTPTPK